MDNDFEKWQQDELKYLQDLKNDPEADVLNVAYVEALQALDKAW